MMSKHVIPPLSCISSYLPEEVYKPEGVVGVGNYFVEELLLHELYFLDLVDIFTGTVSFCII